MKLKKIIFGASLVGLSTFALTSCSSERNTSVPVGDLDLNATVATALNNSLTLNNKNYYNKLRYSGNTLVENKIREALYNKEYKTLTALFYGETLTEEQKNLLIPTKDGEKLFTLEGTELSEVGDDNLTYIKKNLYKSINKQLSSLILGSTSAETIKNYKQDDLDKKYNSFITARARINQTFTKADLTYTLPTDKSDLVSFDHVTDECFKKIVSGYLLTEAANLSAQNALYQIADEEYVSKYDDTEDDEPTKNTNLLYDKDGDYLKDRYDSTIKTYGTYHAIIIQFDSLKQANKAIEGFDFTSTSLDTIKQNYLALYNNYYNYKNITSLNDEKFTFNVNSIKDDFDDLSSSIKTLIKETFEEDPDDITKQYLSQPRNIDNKYVMAIRYDSTYSINDGTEETEWKDLDDATKAKLTKKFKYDILTDNASSYVNTNYQTMIYNRSNNDDESDDILIYDPVFEYKFYSTYSNEYVLMDAEKFDNNNVISIKIDGSDTPFTYSVKDFYNDATKEYGSSVIYNYFSLEYAYKYYDDYVDSDTHDDNVDALDTAISTFKSNEDASYSKEVGLENYLLMAYGYDNKDDVIKYYYDASTCLKSYLAQNVYKEWAKENGDGTYTYDSSLATSSFLKTILDTGNATYSDLFAINLDHVLINLDDDGDGSPDDPTKFFEKTGVTQAEYEEQVTLLAQALYKEAIYVHDEYNESKSYYEVFKFIKNQFELGEKIYNTTLGAANWDEWRDNNNIKFNFLLTVEQLAASSDIDQDSVSNFVEKFKNYVIDTYKACVADDVSTSFDHGSVYVYDSTNKKIELCTKESDSTNITADKMCATEFGYHLLILNSYTEPSKTNYTAKDDPSGIQSAIEVLVYKDEENEDNNIYVTMNSYNEETTKISFNQFFIYYCQGNMSQTSSLDSSISSLIGSMCDNATGTYTSSNFQNYLLINYLGINISSNETLTSVVNAEKNYYKMLVLDYNESTDEDKKSEFYDWVNGDLTIWNRPNQK